MAYAANARDAVMLIASRYPFIVVQPESSEVAELAIAAEHFAKEGHGLGDHALLQFSS